MPNCLLVSASRWHPSHHYRPKPKPGSLRILHAQPNTGFVLPLALSAHDPEARQQAIVYTVGKPPPLSGVVRC